MGPENDFFDRVYSLTTAEQSQEHYAQFARQYDEAVQGNGYATPARCAAALAAAEVPKDAPILDIGCGTGLSGLAAAALGYNVIDGIDFSDEMLEIARTRGVYRSLSRTDLRHASIDGRYAAVMAVGVLNPAHAPASTLDTVMQILTPGGVLVFSLNDHAVADGSYEGRVHEMCDTGAAQCLSREYGDHLPGQDLMSWVYVLRKA